MRQLALRPARDYGRFGAGWEGGRRWGDTAPPAGMYRFRGLL